MGIADATLPMHPGNAQPHDRNSRRGERVQRRELLYSVVRECMTGAGMLHSVYKFKVLSLDSAGREYLIMMDVPSSYLAHTAQLAEMESAIAHGAKERHDMLVAAVYWRMNDMVTAIATPPVVQQASSPEHNAELAASEPEPQVVDVSLSEAEPQTLPAELQRESSPENANGANPSLRNPPAEADFSDTEPVDPPSSLSSTQFGGLS